jgi:hypothetical protein
MMNLSIGQPVTFGRPNGEKTLGVILKVNPKTIAVMQTEDRGGHPLGTKWRVAPSFVTPLTVATQPTPVTLPSTSTWDRWCKDLGFKPEDFGKVITLRNVEFRLTGLNPSRPKNDVEMVRVRDGKRFKCASHVARLALA